MNIKSESREFEVFITSDGEEFIDDSFAQEHQDYLNAKDYFMKTTGRDEKSCEKLLKKCYPYISKLTWEGV